jgi:hypothetical protein
MDFEAIIRPADNIVLQFREMNDSRKTITVKSTDDPKRYKVYRGLISCNHVNHISYMDIEELKVLWIDSIVNGYECVKNEIFMRGMKDVLPKLERQSGVFGDDSKET